MNSCYLYALVQKVVNSVPGLQQNCTAAGKVTLEELSTHLVPNSECIYEFLPGPPTSRRQQDTGTGLRNSSPQATHHATSATTKPAFAISLLTCIPTSWVPGPVWKREVTHTHP